MVHVFQKTHDFVISLCCFPADDKDMYQELLYTGIAIVLLITPYKAIVRRRTII